MLLQLSMEGGDATELGYLLHKNTETVFRRELSFGAATVFFPESTAARCTAALWLDVDPVMLARRTGNNAFALSQYVNDRAYVGSSLLSLAISQCFAGALAGRCRERPGAVAELRSLRIQMPVIDCDAGEDLVRGLYEPLGYSVSCRRLTADPLFPEWGKSTLMDVVLAGRQTVRDALLHACMLLPVLDNDKHTLAGGDDVEKLLAGEQDWLAAHPLRESIARRYLRYRRRAVDEGLERLAQGGHDEDPAPANVEYELAAQAIEDDVEAQIPGTATMGMRELRYQAVTGVMREVGAKRVIDLGCGDGRLLRLLAEGRQLTHIVGMDVSTGMLAAADRRLQKKRLAADDRLRLFQGSLLYKDDRLANFDAAALVEVIEHLEPDRLVFLEHTVFQSARPATVVVTTPNADYNRRLRGLPSTGLRNPDHRFEWSRAQFSAWCRHVTVSHGYTVSVSGIGDTGSDVGSPSAMAVFTRQ